MDRISGENIWITGASSGIGRALAKQLAGAGNQVIASARREDSLQELANEAPGVVCLPLDVARAQDVEAASESLAKILHGQPLDRIVLSAGVCEYFDITEPDWSMFSRVMEVNYLGALRCLEAALPLMTSASEGKGRGHVVAIASQASRVPFPRAEAYGGSKAALTYALESMAAQLDPLGIDVSIVQPGFIETDMTATNDFPMPFLMTVDNAALAIMKELKARPSFLRFPRSLSYMIGAGEKLPSIWRKFVAPSLVRQDS